MSVVISPSEQLEFHRPFTRVSKESLHVKNPGSEPIVFKVKTTAPKQYCVRPNAGRIEANSEIEVQIILQPFREEPPEDYKCKDKFLVQTAPYPVVNDESQNDITTLWSYIEANERENMRQHKIKCVFLGPELRESDELQENESEQQTPQQQEQSPQEQMVEEISPIPEQAKNTEHVASSDTVLPPPLTSTTSTEPSSIQNDVPLKPASVNTTAATIAAPVAANTNSTTPTTTLYDTTRTPREVTQNNLTEATQTKKEEKDMTKEQLKEALDRVELLEKQLADIRKEEGLRARNQTGSSARKLASTVQPLDAVHQHLAALETPRSVEGYPPQVVMGIALLVFIFTYIFF